MTPKMTPERKQELLTECDNFGMVVVTSGELRDLLTEKVCEWARDCEGEDDTLRCWWVTGCGWHVSTVDSMSRPCWCGGKVTVTR